MKKYALLFFVLCFSLLTGDIAFSNAPVERKSGLDLYGDFLVLYASEEPSNSWANVFHSSLGTGGFRDSFDAAAFTFDWNFGFRTGVGYYLEHDQWDTEAYFTWFQTQNRESFSAGTVMSEYFGGFLNGDIANRTTIDWNLRYNMFDWELGRNFGVSKRIFLRPFLGVKGGWINQSIFSTWNVTSRNVDGVITPVNYTATENLKNNFWGVGPSGGVDSTWNFGNFISPSLNLFGDFSAAVLWGTWSFKDIYHNSTPTNISVNMDTLHLGALMVGGFVGIGWDGELKQLHSHVSARIGYEMQLWVNHLRMPTFQILPLHGDLTLQGGILRCRVDF